MDGRRFWLFLPSCIWSLGSKGIVNEEGPSPLPLVNGWCSPVWIYKAPDDGFRSRVISPIASSIQSTYSFPHLLCYSTFVPVIPSLTSRLLALSYWTFVRCQYFTTVLRRNSTSSRSNSLKSAQYLPFFDLQLKVDVTLTLMSSTSLSVLS